MSKRGKTVALAACACALAWLAGCYLTTDLDGYSGELAEAEAGTPVEGGARDAGDAGNVGDASDGSVVDAADSGFDCRPGDFCDDFERTALVGPWDTNETGNGGMMFLTTNAYRGSGALRTTMTTQNGAYAALVTSRPKASAISLSFRLFVDPSFDRNVGIMPIQVFNPGNRFNQVFVNVFERHVSIAEQEIVDAAQTYFDETNNVPLRFGVWVPVTLEVDFRPTAPRLKATYDGQVLGDEALARSWAPSPFNLRGGLNFAAAGTAGQFDIDDVVLRTIP